MIHQIFYEPSLAISQGLVMYFLVLTLSKMLLRCYNLPLMTWKALQWQAASDLISNTIRISVSCNQCFCFSAKEEKLDILAIALSPNINSSFSKFLKPEILESDNKWFCASCNCLTESTRETSIISSGSILVLVVPPVSYSNR